MRYDITLCLENDAELIWEKSFEAVPTAEGAEPETLVFKATDEKGDMIGGCVLDIDETKTAEFDRLWVAEGFRGRGVGSALIRAAEIAARYRGCRTAVNTYNFDFQTARTLFEALGYTLIGTVVDWPRGHESYTLMKKLDDRMDALSPAERFMQTGFAISPGSEEDGEIIAERLEASNRAFAPRSHEYIDIDRKIEDEEGRIIAGCIAGVSGWDTLHIDAFWVDERYRGTELGEKLLAVIEREARENGAYLAAASGTEAIAEFYKKQGYTVSYAFEDEPKWFVLHKRL